MMTHLRMNSLRGTGKIGDGWNHSPLRADQSDVRLPLQCVCVPLIAFFFDRF